MAVITQGHHRAEFTHALENTHIDAVGNAEQYHDQDNDLQHTKLPFIHFHRFFVKIIQFHPGFDFQV